MTIYKLINEANARGIELYHENEQLKLKAPKGSLTPELKEQLVKNKSEIIAFLKEISASKQELSIPVAPRVDDNGKPIKSFPLSFSQERLWFIHQLEPESASYNIPKAVRINGEFEVAHLEQAFQLLIARHESLRTVFPSESGQARQVVREQVEFNLTLIDLTTPEHSETCQRNQHEKVKQLCEAQAAKPFDLSEGPLFRVVLYKLSALEHVLILTLHHIISDGWSTGVMVKEFGAIMEALQNKVAPENIDTLTPLPIQYVDYSVWQRRVLLDEGVLQKQLAYWQSKLDGVPESLNLATSFPRTAAQTTIGAKQKFTFDSALTRQLNRLSELHGCTLFMTLLAAFNALLYRYTGQSDICIGSPIANRQHGDTQGLIGMFVNTLALRNQVDAEAPFASLLSQVKMTCLDAYEHQDTPFEKIVDAVQPERNMSLSPLFQVMFVLQNAPKEKPGQTIRAYSLDNEHCKFDLTLAMSESPDGLIGSLEYRTALYCPQFIESMLQHFTALCRSIVVDPMVSIFELQYLNSAEQQCLLQDFNQTRVEYAKDKCIHDLFYEQVTLNPDSIAVVHAGQSLTYRQLNAKSQMLALYLQSLGVGPDSLVGLCVNRSIDMLVGMLGILQAGGAYVPLDPDYPDDRLSFMLRDSQAEIILTQQHLETQLSAVISETTQLLSLDSDWARITQEVATLQAARVSLKREVRSHHLAYVIYTSGSTGQPKGVLIEHKSLHSFCLWYQQAFAVSPETRATQMANIAFDASVLEIWPVLLRSASLYIVNKDIFLDMDSLHGFLNANNITLSFLATPVAQQLLQLQELNLPDLRYMSIGGDKLSHYEDKGYSFTLVNNYGPTESTIVTTSMPIAGQFGAQIIGGPIFNTQTYILDSHLNMQPVGVPGELYIAGDGLARGYLNRSDLNEQKFIANPFVPGTRMYKSGDLARWRNDGTIEFLGRIDSQVKIRGYRIEIGEIESQLNSHPGIRESVVLALEKTDSTGIKGLNYLAAWYVREEDACDIDFTQDGILEHLRKQLPDYMIPVAFTELVSIPLTSNGKVDRRKLESSEVNLIAGQEYVEPKNDTEWQLVKIWADLLNLPQEKIGIHDNFFELGGHSLLATRLISRIRTDLKVDIPLKALFEQSDIAGFAKLVIEAQSQTKEFLPVISRVTNNATTGAGLPLSFAQERLSFIDSLQGGSPEYNIPMVFSVNGELNVKLMKSVFVALIERHEILRTVYVLQEGETRQLIRSFSELDFDIRVEDLTHLDGEQLNEQVKVLLEADITQPFDLANELMLRVSYLKKTSTSGVLVFNMHHIASDGWSMEVLSKEFCALYQAFSLGKVNPLTELPFQYADYAYWQRRYLSGDLLETQLRYWQQQLDNLPVLHSLRLDHSRPVTKQYKGALVTGQLSAAMAKKLQELAKQHKLTPFMLLHGALSLLLSRHSGTNDIVIGTPVANRLQPGLDSLIGFFVNTLVLRVNVAQDNLAQYLAHIRQVHVDAQSNQDVPFEQLVERLNVPRSTAHSPLFQIMMTLNSEFGQATENGAGLSGLNDVDIKPLKSNLHQAKFDLNLAVDFSEQGIALRWIYDVSLFSEQHIAQLNAHLCRIIEGIVQDSALSSAPLQAVPMLSAEELRHLVYSLNDTAAVYPKDRCIHESFAEQVAYNPEEVAVIDGDKRITYQELFDKSQVLALYLQSQGVQPDNLIGICTDRSIEMLIGMLGILQAGGAYVPLDPNYPEERIAYMLQDSKAKLVLSEQAIKDRLNIFDSAETPLNSLPVVLLDSQWTQICEVSNERKKQGFALDKKVTSAHLAYVIYTSGSTGKPKGVAIEHHSPMALISWAQDVFSPEELKGVLAATSISFDLSVFEIFLTLSVGGTIILAPNIMALPQLRNKEAITLINTVPSAMEELVRMNAIPDTVKTINLAGEPLLQPLVEHIYINSKVEKVYDLYGPSEDTTYSTFTLREKQGKSNIGRPIGNTQVYILDALNNPTPLGVAGELHVAGEGLARGYLNRPELTNEKFVANPFVPGQRMYKTGDLARWQENGTLEYLGRIGTQVKIRGFRIELGEIEAQLLRHPSVVECAVVAQGKEGLEKQLVAFCVTDDRAVQQQPSEELNGGQLKAHLQKVLPDYMVPTAFVSLQSIPLTPNGKVDRRALESREVSVTAGKLHQSPRNDTEQRIVAIWADVLALAAQRIGVHDNFFELGGHSLLAVRLIAKINIEFALSLPLATLFTAPSPAALAELILNEHNGLHDILVPIQPDGEALPIFAVPGAGGNVLSFQPLSEALGNEQPLYGLQAVGLDGKTPPMNSVEQTAMANIRALKSIQPEGPYRLIGHSYGGVVAYEMARILLQQNQQVLSLTLLDSFTPLTFKNHKKLDETTVLIEVCIALANLYGLNLNLNFKNLQLVSRDKLSEYITDLFKRHGVDIAPSQFDIYYKIYEANLHCYRNYTPSKLSQAIDVFLYSSIERQKQGAIESDDHGWNDLLLKPLQRFDIRGNHYTMLHKGHVQQIVNS